MPADDEGLLDAFGYHEDHRVLGDPAISVQVKESKHRDTLEPQVVVYFRFAKDDEQVGVLLPLFLAEGLVGHLQDGIRRARERHFQ